MKISTDTNSVELKSGWRITHMLGDSIFTILFLFMAKYMIFALNLKLSPYDKNLNRHKPVSLSKFSLPAPCVNTAFFLLVIHSTTLVSYRTLSLWCRVGCCICQSVVLVCVCICHCDVEWCVVCKLGEDPPWLIFSQLWIAWKIFNKQGTPRQAK